MQSSKNILTFFVCMVLNLMSLSDLKAQVKDAEVVFMIGEHDKAYNQMMRQYNTMLLTACKDDINTSFEIWNDFLKELEIFSTRMNIDLKGVKLWINVFWAANGRIDHIVYFPKPNSRNLDYKQLVPVLTEFSKNYQLPISYKSCYSHYGSANFPIVARSLIGNNKQ